MDFVRKKMRRIGASQLVEDGVQRERKAEKRSTNTIMVSQRVFATLIDRKVLGNTHRYREAGPLHAVACSLFALAHSSLHDVCLSRSELVRFEHRLALRTPIPFRHLGLGDVLSFSCRGIR